MRLSAGAVRKKYRQAVNLKAGDWKFGVFFCGPPDRVGLKQL